VKGKPPVGYVLRRKENQMSQTSNGMKQQESGVSGMGVDMKLEVDIIPLSDVERSKQQPNKHLRYDCSVSRANIFLFHHSDRGRTGAEKELAVDGGLRIKPLSVLVGSIGARIATSDHEGSS
jgi:hypothetical protein